MKKKHPKWGCFVISFQMANEEGIFMSGMSVWRTLNPNHKPPKKFNCYEISKPFGMLHGDVMIGKRLPNGTFLYQLSWQDDYSRGYVSCVIGTSKNSILVIKGLIEAVLKHKVIPTVLHYDNGTEGKCKIVEVFCESLGSKLIHSTVNQPNTNGKKERAHRDDKRDFWSEIKSANIDYIKKKNEEYVEWRNTKKGHWALKGKPSITRLKENKKPLVAFTKEYLESLAQVKIATRRVREGGLIFIPKGSRFVEKKYTGKTVELWETLNGLEIIYRENVIDIIEDYWEKIKV
jgi:hypothetical protein